MRQNKPNFTFEVDLSTESFELDPVEYENYDLALETEEPQTISLDSDGQAAQEYILNIAQSESNYVLESGITIVNSTKGDGDYMPLVDLGIFSINEYDQDFWNYLEDKVDSGFFKVTDTNDGFDYFFRIERTKNQIYQEWWSEEEGALYKNLRTGQLNNNTWEWSDSTCWITNEQLYDNFYEKQQTYNKIEVDNKLINKVDNETLENNYYTSDQVDDLLEGIGGSDNYEELNNKPSINGITLTGNKTTSDLGIIVEETDPTVPSWAKQPTKPSYTASEVGALPNTTNIPDKTSDLINDSGFITELVTDLGTFSIVEYDWDFWAFLEDKVENGFFKITDVDDGFDYFFRIERTDNQVYQEWWYEEESALYRNIRVGWLNDEEWDWSDTTCWVTDEQLYSNFYGKWQTYNKTEIDGKLALKADSSALGNYYTDSEVDDILENNYYTMDTIDEMFESYTPVASNMIETTWAALRNLRDSGQLVKGAWYRITDYNFVTTKIGMQSGNHQFDIVLLAISESMVSESGYACKHSGDHYFEREVTEGGIEWLYTVYVDEYGENYGDEPFDHQDDLHASDEFCDSGVLPHPATGDDVPVLYKTDTGEYDIDDPDYDDAYFYEGVYDFDGDEYDMWGKYEFSYDDDEWVFKQQYALTPIVVEDGELIVSPIPETKIVPVNMNAWELKYCLDNDKDLFDWAETDGKGVIYWLKDEFGNEAPYDFKNVMYRRHQVSAVSNSVLNSLRNLYLYEDGYYALTRNNNSKYYYTFMDSEGNGDGSLFGECTYNVIMPYIYLSPKGKNIRGINDVVLQNANRNTLQHNCRNITILYSATDNILSGCFNICGTSYSRCLIGINSSSVTFYLLQNANFDNCRQIIGQQADTPKIGSGCNLINLGNSSVGTVMGTSCNNITLGQWCYNINIGYSVGDITFGNYCSYLTIGSYCTHITTTNYYRYCTVEDNVTRLDFATTGGNTSNYVQYVKVCRGVSNKSITPARKMSYEQIYYAAGRTETAL